MNVNTFFEARELYDKYILCETVLEYLSDEDKPQGQKFLETLKTFVNVFQGDFMMFVHNKMIEVGEQFESIHCPEHSDSGLVPPPLPEVPKEPVFPIGSKVEIADGDHNGEVGTVHNYESGQYYVVSPQFSMWFPETELKAYVEESEEPTEDEGLTVGDHVKVIGGIWEDLYGSIGIVSGFNEERNTILVVVNEDSTPYEFFRQEIVKITPDENGTGDTDPTEGE